MRCDFKCDDGIYLRKLIQISRQKSTKLHQYALLKGLKRFSFMYSPLLNSRLASSPLNKHPLAQATDLCLI